MGVDEGVCRFGRADGFPGFTGFLASTVPESGSKEDDASSCDLSDDDDEDAPERENILRNAVLGMTQSAKYL